MNAVYLFTTLCTSAYTGYDTLR